jgi:hypothetical protein
MQGLPTKFTFRNSSITPERKTVRIPVTISRREDVVDSANPVVGCQSDSQPYMYGSCGHFSK